MKETAVIFGKNRSLIGIITEPSADFEMTEKPAVIILNAGMVHRAGPNRLHVQWARALAQLGFLVLRFDYSGIGDSEVREDKLPFSQTVISEAQDAMDLLSHERGMRRFILMGICSGARHSFLTARSDLRVIGVILINSRGNLGLGRSKELSTHLAEQEKVRNFWNIALSKPSSWLKALKGQVSYKNILSVLGIQLKGLLSPKDKHISQTDQTKIELRRLLERGVGVLFIFSQKDHKSLDYFKAIIKPSASQQGSQGQFAVQIVKHADHIFTPLASQKKLLRLIQDFVIAKSNANLSHG